MRVRIAANTSLPGGFVIEAETDAEIMFLRSFADFSQSGKDKGQLAIANIGGNIGEGKFSMMIHYAAPPIEPEKETS